MVIYHFGLGVPPFDKGILHTVFSFGNEAVNYFFFLSGFIMVVAYYKPADSNGVISKRKYWINRFARIYPVYFLALIAVAIYYWTIDSSLFTSFKLRLPIELVLIQSWIGKTSINFPGWSLSVELFFYISFPFLLPLIAKLSSRKLAFSGIAIYAIAQLVYVVILLRFGTGTRSELAINYSPFLNFGTFVFGTIIGMLIVRHLGAINQHKGKIKAVGYFLSLVLLGLFIYAIDFQRFHHNGLLVPVYALFILAFIPSSGITNWLGNSFFVFLGDISYSIYILQYPVWLFFRHYLGIEGSFTTNEFFGYILTLIIISAIVFKWYEQKSQYLIRGLFYK